MNLDCGPILIIVNKVKGKDNHAEILTNLLKARGVNLPTISGYISKKKKEELINDLKECKIPGAIAGPKVLSAGISIHSLSTIILAGAGRSDSEFIQRVGRLLRKKEGKKRPLVIDFQDPQFWFASQTRSRIETAESIYGSDNIILK
jgi:superfamily II DNA or RNA helicase